MSFNYVKYRDESAKGIVTLICDTEEDIVSLPTNPQSVAPGSTTKVIQSGNTYILNSKYEWQLFNEGGGDNLTFTVTYTGSIDEQTQELVVRCDKTYQEITDAISAGKNIICRLTGIVSAQTASFFISQDDGTLVFTVTVWTEDQSATFITIVHAANDDIFVMNSQ